ncbi:MAG: V-type ATP synthase subunit D [Clostridia bacterium]|nr:V-type ATP synthase subunit D [Clostridia bacterium]
MAEIRVNPTRMELIRLKRRLVTARRGHKLLKDKRDELMKRFLHIVRENKTKRERMEELLNSAYREFVLARAILRRETVEQALMMGKPPLEIAVSTVNMMSVEVSTFEHPSEEEARMTRPPYGMADTAGELDAAIAALYQAYPIMLSLAENEKAAQLLADEIERTRRRVNSLEYILIPQLTAAIRVITMKLDENERGNLVRLMKVKDMMVQQAIRAARKAQGLD